MKYSFRFAQVKQQIAEELFVLLGNNNIIAEICKLRKSDKYVVIIDLDLNTMDMAAFQETVKSLIKLKKLRKTQYGIWIYSFSDAKRNEIIVPSVLSDFHQNVGGNIAVLPESWTTGISVKGS